MSYEHCALPSDVPGYHGSEGESSEPRESCPECGEWLKPGQAAKDCEHCAEQEAAAYAEARLYHDACVLSGVPCAECIDRLAGGE